MRLLVVLTCVLAGCLAEKPHPCSSPPLLSGAFTLELSTQNGKELDYITYLYDAVGQRIRLRENKTLDFDVLLLFKEATMYEINEHDRTCKKSPLTEEFQPLEVPKNASLLAQVVLGSSSVPGQGLLVNTWTGDLPNNAGKFVITVTEFGCIPVSTVYHIDQFGSLLMSFFNNIIGISDPSLLSPPDFCPSAEMEVDIEEPADFLSLFHNLLRWRPLQNVSNLL